MFKSWTELADVEGNVTSVVAKTEDVSKEQASFEGNASAVVVVAKTEEGVPGGSPSDRCAFILHCIGLDTFLTPMTILVYFHARDGQNIGSAREHYQSIFKIGSCWRISGKIGHYAESVYFDDPVYMPYAGEIPEILNNAARNYLK